MNKRKLKWIMGCCVFLIGCSLFGCKSKTVLSSSAPPVENAIIENAPTLLKPIENLISSEETGSILLEGLYTVDGTADTRDSENLESTAKDQNTVLVKNKGNLILSHAILHKSGNTSDTGESNSYALNSIFASVGGSSATISDTSLESSSKGSTAVFASGSASNITISDSTILTTGADSRGLSTSHGGSITVSNVTINTEGANSPGMYSGGAINAENTTGVAANSPCAVVEGNNSITLTNSTLTGGGENGVMLYQATPRDASTGTTIFTASDSSLSTTSDAPLFYITNTNAEITLSNTSLQFPSGVLLQASGNNTKWGTEGANSGNVILRTANQVLTGAVTCDSISLVSLILTDNSAYSGVIDAENTGNVTICPDSSSTWNVTGDSYVSAITNDDHSLSFLHSNGYTVYYDASNSLNEWLSGNTISLSGGGVLTPAITESQTE